MNQPTDYEQDRGPYDSDDDCMDCGMCESCIERSIEHEEEMAPVNHFTNIRGPQQCPRRCNLCADGRHHWMYTTVGMDDLPNNPVIPPQNPIVAEWLERLAYGMLRDGDNDECVDFLACKHCEAVHEITEAMLEDPEFEIV